MIAPDFQRVVVPDPACVVNIKPSKFPPRFCIIFPHKHTFINDEALWMNLRLLEKNTTHPFELIIIEDPEGGRIDPYRAWNVGLDYVTAPYFVFHNTDLMVSKKWDEAYVRHLDEGRILTDYLIEPGALGCYEKNINANMGACPRCFRLEDFERFCEHHSQQTPDCVPGMGYYIQAMLPTKAVREVGKFPDDVPFMFRPNDAILFERLEAKGLKHFRVNSWAYHFQNLTARRNQCACYHQDSIRPGEQP